MTKLLSKGPASRSLIAAVAALFALTAAVAASPGLRLYFASDFKDLQYQKGVYKKVADAWKRPKEMPAAGKKTVIITSIMRDGTITGTKIHFGSGSEAWDQAAKAAVDKGAPFKPLPEGYKGPSVEVHFHFEVLE